MNPSCPYRILPLLAASTLALEFAFSPAAEALPPPAPTNLRVTQSSTSAINLAWQHSGSNLSEFDILMADSANGPYRFIGSRPADTRDAGVFGLAANRLYSFQVCAKNSTGITCSNKISARTALSNTAPTTPAAPPTPPSNLSWRRIGAGTARVFWQHNGNNVASFRVQVQLPEGRWTTPVNVAANQRSYDLVPLMINTTYRAQVCAVGGSGALACAAPFSIILQQGF